MPDGTLRGLPPIAINQDGLHASVWDTVMDPGLVCVGGHSQSYCAGWNTAAGITTHCDQPGWPSCYDIGYLARRNASSCPTGHSQIFCSGYAAGVWSTAFLDTHCDRLGYASCYLIGYEAGKSTPGTSYESGHSLNFCSGWEFSRTSGIPPVR